MLRAQRVVSVFCILLLMVPALPGQTAQDPAGKLKAPPAHQTFKERITSPYRQQDVAPVSMANSNRLESLMRAGLLYLSLSDVIALALENNLDLEVQRYGPTVADVAITRARAGGFARAVSTAVTPGPASATGASATFATPAVSSAVPTTGAPLPNLDPTLIGSVNFSHQTTPQTSTFVTGTTSLVTRANNTNLQVSQGFLTGTTASLGVNTLGASSNNRNADFNPNTTGAMTLNVSQHLLQGFGRAVNNRQIRIARNNREVADLTFKNQVVTTATAVINLYWDLVTYNEDVRSKKQALGQSEKLYNDNKKQVEIGTLAPIEIVRAEAEVATRQQDLTISETQVLQQETILKNALSRNGLVSPSVADARIVPTDRFRLPDVEAIAPMQDLVAQAIASRPEMGQSRILLENQKINLKAARNALLPTLDAVVNLSNNGLAGEQSNLALVPGRTRTNDAYFFGGTGTVFSQIFSRNFPTYSLGFNLNIPLRNRTAQADVITDQLSLRQQELLYQRQINQVRVDVQNAVIGLQQARVRYMAAQKSRILQEQTLDAEQKKYALGASTIYNVILVQRDLAAAQSNETAALGAYSKAGVEMDRATGRTLAKNEISMDEAFKGQVSKPASRLPDVAPKP